MAKCLVTGHVGYIGSHLFEELKKQGHEVVGIDLQGKFGKDILSWQGFKPALNGDFNPKWKSSPLSTELPPDYIFHLACFPRVAYSVDNPLKTMENNVLCTSYVLNYARKIGVKRVIYSSSSSVMGNGDGPESPYALQKLISEMECKIYSKMYGLDTVCLRYFNVYSKDQNADGPYATAIANWMKHIKEGHRPFITGDGEQRRDMLHVSDAVRANIFAMEHKGRFDGKNFDVGTGSNISLNEIKDIVKSYFPTVDFDYADPRPGDVLETRAKTEPLNKLGWSTDTSIESGIDDCFRGVKNEL